MKARKRINEIAGASRLETSALLDAVITYLDERDEPCIHEPDRCKEWCPVGAREELESPPGGDNPEREPKPAELLHGHGCQCAKCQPFWPVQLVDRCKDLSDDLRETIAARDTLRAEVNRLNAEAFELKRKLDIRGSEVRALASACDNLRVQHAETCRGLDDEVSGLGTERRKRWAVVDVVRQYTKAHKFDCNCEFCRSLRALSDP